MHAMRMMRMGPAFYGFGPGLTTLRRGRRLIVNEWERALLFRRGRLVDTLGPGAHRRWGGGYETQTIDVRPWVLNVPTQEIPTADGIPVKLTVAGRVRVADPRVFVTATRDATEALYLAVQIALREVTAATTVDDLLSGRGELGTQLRDGLRGVDDLGVVVEALELKDIVLPAELKRAQAQVLVARAEGQAALERARGETAALRSLANGARLAADQPALLQLRMLQQLGTSGGHTVVITPSM
jgi:regulator of protease activity HflC (stomatin/prohibitin superfamily)